MRRGEILQSKVFEIGKLIDRDVDLHLAILDLVNEQGKNRELLKEQLKQLKA